MQSGSLPHSALFLTSIFLRFHNSLAVILRDILIEADGLEFANRNRMIYCSDYQIECQRKLAAILPKVFYRMLIDNCALPLSPSSKSDAHPHVPFTLLESIMLIIIRKKANGHSVNENSGIFQIWL